MNSRCFLTLCVGIWLLAASPRVAGQQLTIIGFQDGLITWSNSAPEKVKSYAVQWASSLNSNIWQTSWSSLDEIAPRGAVMSAEVPRFFRVAAYRLLEPSEPAELLVLYSNAMKDAAVTLASEVSSRLTPVTEANTRLQWRTNSQGTHEVKVASFMAYQTATNFYGLGPHELAFGSQWVTVCPELKTFCQTYSGTNRLLRIKQVLGMPPNSSADTVVEFWVSPEFLVRPCPDPEINDSSAGLVMNMASPSLTSGIALNSFYPDWFKEVYESRNYEMINGVYNAWPWTRLGYTYDWGCTTPNHFGLSEFAIPSGMLFAREGVKVPIEVVDLVSAANYGK